MKFGAHFLPEDYPELVQWVKASEKYGFDQAWYVDSHMLWRDVYAYMAICAIETKKIKLGTAVTNPKTRHPTVTASAIGTVNELSNHRALLGIGRGDSAVRTIGERPSSPEDLAKAIASIRALTQGEPLRDDNVGVKIRWAKTRIPIYVAATGPRMLKLAGRIADGVMIYVGTHPTAVKWAIGRIRKGAEADGRDFRKIPIAVFTACGLNSDMKKGREEVRWCAASATNHLRDVLASNPPGTLPLDVVKDLERTSGKYDYNEHLNSEASHAKVLSDEIIDQFAIVGNADSCIEKILLLEKLGVTEVHFAYLNRKESLMRDISRQIFSKLH